MRVHPIPFRFALPILLLGTLAMAGCSRQSPLAPRAGVQASHAVQAAASAACEPVQTPADWSVQHREGRTGPHSTYALDVPSNWNRELVVYAHGYVENPFESVGLPNNGPVRQELLARGYAVAASSFDETGYAVKDGVQRTHQLTELFTSAFGAPTRVYIVGVSLGGIIGLQLAETYPDQYAGALLVSGVVGGTRSELDYIATVRVLFDHYYPGVLPGSLYHADPVYPPDPLVGRIVGAIQANPAPVGIIAAVMGGRLPARSPQELVGSIVRALVFQVNGANDLADRTREHPFFDNRDVQYTGPVPDAVLAELNANVDRYASTPDAVNYLEHYYEPTGMLRIPVVTMHNEFDPVVPMCNETRLGAAVEHRGSGAFLMQHCVTGTYGHVVFQPCEIGAAFDELVGWVHTGVKPVL